MSRQYDKIKGIPAFISAGIAALCAFGFFMANEDETYRLLITIGSGISMFVTLSGLLAFSMPNGGSANIKIVSALFFIAFLIIHIIFSFVGITLWSYVVFTGILLLVFMFICYQIIMRLLK